MKKLLCCLLGISLLCGCSKEEEKKVEVKQPEQIVEKEKTDITLSFVGDITLGKFADMSYSNSFDDLYKKKNNDKNYFFKNVKSYFEKDDLTIGNLEGTLTTATSHMDKPYAFKGLPEYADIIKAGHFEIVSVANNHSADYFGKGTTDTKKNLDKAGIQHFGYENSLIVEKKGKKIGFLGYSFASQGGVPSHIKTQMSQAIETLRKEVDIVVVYYHWGMMYEYVPQKKHIEFAHYTIDHGADLVVGTHPHVIQGMETYKGKNIVYSLGNFCYGGSKKSKDYDSMIFQQTFSFEDNELVNSSYQMIPCSLSSAKNKNNYQPTPLSGKEKTRVENKFKKYSKQIH